MDNGLKKRKSTVQEANTKFFFFKLLERLEEYDERYRNLIQLNSKDKENLYFKDGERKIDFVFVYDYGSKRCNKEKVNAFISNLEDEGLEFEGEKSESNADLLFIKVHAPTNILIRLAFVYNIEPTCERKEDYRMKKAHYPRFMETELTSPNVNSKVYQRAKESVSGSKPKNITSAERIMIIYELLKTAKYGNAAHEFGISSLIDNKFLQSAYPMHDGGYEWTDEGPLNDRQLLSKYWGNLSCFLKTQPIQLICKYYGPEIAFYFAFFGLYNRMLIWASILGIISFVYGLFTFNTVNNDYSKDICNSDYIVCPSCPYHRICYYQALKEACFSSKVTYIFDNMVTFCYAIIICFWATLTLELSKRYQSTLIYKWNLYHLEDDTTIRPSYPLKTKFRRVSKLTGELEAYTPMRVRIWRIIISSIVILLLIFLEFIMVVCVIVIRLILRYELLKIKRNDIFTNYISTTADLISNTLGLIFMIIFELTYTKVAQMLTDYENPRTQTEYDKSYIYKQFILCFLNAYAILYYTALFKGTFSTYPGDEDQYRGIGILNIDLCGKAGCVLDVAIQLVIIIIGKALVKSSWRYIKPLLAIYYKRLKRRVKRRENFKLWERFYYEKSTHQYFLFIEFRDLILQYGYILLFTAAFPLAPLLALAYNIFELRVEAYKLVRFYRRPIPIRVCGTGPWNEILQTMTWIGIVTNAFIIAFTTHFVPFIINTLGYQTRRSEDYMNRTFSKFRIEDFGETVDSELKTTKFGNYCYYVGTRYPPEHPQAYHLTGNYWYVLAIRFLTVLILIFFILCFTGLLAFAIPDIPRSVQERLNLKRRLDDETREEIMTKSIQRQIKSKHSDANYLTLKTH